MVQTVAYLIIVQNIMEILRNVNSLNYVIRMKLMV
nr:MAG TPA: hypothetical protein [Caudoviricetes sp.]